MWCLLYLFAIANAICTLPPSNNENVLHCVGIADNGVFATVSGSVGFGAT